MTTSQATNALADYVQEKGVALTTIAEKTKISYNAVYASLGSRTRPIKGDELLEVCNFLEVDPRRFLRWERKGETA